MHKKGKIRKTVRKCYLMEKTWRDVFRITEEEEEYFDKQHSDYVDGYINLNYNRVNSYPTVDINRLYTGNHHARVITIDEIKMYIKRSKKKAPGFTKINIQILQNCTENTFLQLKKNIYNACLSIGYFPTVFKEAIIKFIPKKDKSPLNPTNYRPISLLEVPGKIFERLIQARLNTFLHENNIIEDRQHGFRTYKGTNTDRQRQTETCR